MPSVRQSRNRVELTEGRTPLRGITAVSSRATPKGYRASSIQKRAQAARDLVSQNELDPPLALSLVVWPSQPD